MVNVPASLVVAVRTSDVRSLVTVILAPAIACPEVSMTSPVMDPVVVIWAESSPQLRHVQQRQTLAHMAQLVFAWSFPLAGTFFNVNLGEIYHIPMNTVNRFLVNSLNGCREFRNFLRPADSGRLTASRAFVS